MPLDRAEPMRLDGDAIATEIGALVFFGLAHADLLAAVVRHR
jgi:hypothetical protein